MNRQTGAFTAAAAQSAPEGGISALPPEDVAGAVLFDHGRLLFNSAFTGLLEFNGIDTAAKLWQLEGTAVKKILKERGTEKVLLKNPDGGITEAYIKRYHPVPLKEKIKQAFSLKFRVFDAFHEWHALYAFHRAGLNTITPLAVADAGNGRSCNLTLGITDYVKASELFKNFTPDDRKRKLSLIRRIAFMAGRMHAAGFAHQDFYLVHLFVRPDENDRIYLIDLQRLLIRRKLSRRLRVKDLGQLLFSARPELTKTDIRRFWKYYCDFAGRNLYRNRPLLRAITAKADRITARDARKGREK